MFVADIAVDNLITINAMTGAVVNLDEPFYKDADTLHVIRRVNDPTGFNFGARRFTISTVGFVPAIQRFIEERSQVNLAISLHAADDELRSKLLPVNKKYPVDVLFTACLEYIHTFHRRIIFEWALID